MIGGVTRQGGSLSLPDRVTLLAGVRFCHVNVSRWGNPPSRGRIRDTWNSRKIHFGGGFASVKGNKRKPQHWRLQQEQQVSAEENQSPKHLVCQHFSRLRA